MSSTWNLPENFTPAWISAAAENMQRGVRLSPAPDDSDSSRDSPPGDNQLDFFRKLGYSTAQVRTVLQKFGLNTDTNSVLGELVRTGGGGGWGPVTTVSGLVPKGDPAASGTPNPSLPVPSPQSLEEAGEGGDALRPVVIDGSNVAMSHGNKEVFSCLGIQLAVTFFLDRGHTDITVFVPSWRKEQPRPDVPISDQHILRDGDLERRRILVFTPSRRVAGKRVVCYDDRFIVKLAYELDGVIVSNDTYRDLQGEKPEWKRFIEERLLMYSFVNDKFMLPDDPLGRHGPTLENFLRRVPKTLKKQLCPYGRKCTYGIKCKFHHPERPSHSGLSLADELRGKGKLSSSHASSGVNSGPAGSSHGPSLEEAMAQKLTLEQSSGALRKPHVSENVVLVKAGHHSGRRHAARKEKGGHHPSHDLLDSAGPRGSPLQLDSGLGSVESQAAEALWKHCKSHYGDEYRSGHLDPHKGHQYYVTSPVPCSCCSHGPPPPGTLSGFQPHSQRHSMGPAGAHSPDMMAYGSAHYAGYGAPAYPVSVHAYSQPANFQHGRVHPPSLQQPYWSDPFGAHPHAANGRSGERSHWECPQGPQPKPHVKERENVRKKLLAIFNVHLVDKAMDMFPNLMDPQMLAAEIVMLQSQDRVGR